MAEFADMMLGGVLCEGCGVALDCEDCEAMGIPMYCSKGCAKDRGASKEQVCNHSN